MQVQVQELEPCKVALDIEVEPERVAEVRKRAVAQLAVNVSVPGFRRGKAPAALVERFVKPDVLREHVLEELIKEAVREALVAQQIEPYGDPQIESGDATLEDNQPFHFRTVVEKRPVVRLGSYTDLIIEVPMVRVTDDAVERRIKALQKARAGMFPVDRPAEPTDFVVVENLTADIPDSDSSQPQTITVVAGTADRPLDQAVVGKSAGDEVVVPGPVPAGEDSPAPEQRVRVREVRAWTEPPLDESFAQSLLLPSVADLHSAVRRTLQSAADEINQHELQDRVIKTVFQSSRVDLPASMVDRFVAAEMASLSKSLKSTGTSWQQYLREKQMSLPNYQEMLAQDTREQLVVHVLLATIAEEEGLIPEPEPGHEEHGHAPDVSIMALNFLYSHNTIKEVDSAVTLEIPV